ncbi:MAG TPA: hypothetical protein VMD53_14740 [Rhizomicrobium sp.]|nr:hypothetical protein [Rhizomicrobium sp.]
MSDFHTDAATVPVAAGRPLLIVDADEVLLAFARGFDRFLNERGCYLDLVSYRLHGNVRRRKDDTPLIDIEVTGLLDEFRSDLDWLEPIDGACETIAALREAMAIVVVSNVSPGQAPARLKNLRNLGLIAPLLANSGPKGPAVKTLAKRAGKPVFFVDDVPMHHASVAELAPDVVRIHFVGDDRLKALMPPSLHAHLRADHWRDIDAFIRAQLKEH